MPVPLRCEDLQRSLDLHQCGNEIGSMVALFARSLPLPSGAPLPIPALTMTRSSPPNSAASAANTTGTENGLPNHLSSLDILRSAKTLPPV